MHDQTLARFRAAAIGAMILGGALCGFARTAHADSVYKCRTADGLVAFQDRPCEGTAGESRVEIPPPPPVSPSPDYGPTAHEDEPGRSRASSSVRGHAAERHEPVSYECHAADGEVFYRHGACPRQIIANGTDSPGTRKRSGNRSQTFAVSAEPLPRGEACRRMGSAGSIGRAGHERDDSVSTYDRNLGRDPCRYL